MPMRATPRNARRQGARAARLAARARSDRADRHAPAAHSSRSSSTNWRTRFGDAPALLSDAGTLSYGALAGAHRTATRAGRSMQGLGQGRRRRPDDAEPAGIHGDLARHHPRRRRRGAVNTQSARALARPLHRHRRAEAYHRRRRTLSQALAGARPASRSRRENLVARRRARFRPHRSCGRAVFAAPLLPAGAPRA